MPYPLLLTAAGEVAVPTLLREVGKIGIKQFIKTYGSSTWQSIAGATIGGTIATKTPPLNLQNKELFGIPKGSMPTATRAQQMDAMMAVPDTTHKSVTDTPSGLVIGGEKKEPLPPPEPFTTPADPQEPTILSTPEAEKQDTTLITPEPEKIDTTLSTPISEPQGPQIFYSKKDDISQQTKELVPEKPEFGKLTKTEIQTAKVLKGDSPDFYSRAVESIKNAKPDKLTKTKWKSYIESTKDEMDYLGLTEFLKGNESITKEELLKFVEKKDIAPNITVRSIPKDVMNKMYETYSLGGYTAGGTDDTQEHIVFQVEPEFYDVKQGKKPTIDSYVFTSEHFDPMTYGKNTFAHARTQVGYDPLEGEMIERLRDLDIKPEEIEKAFKNTLIIDEIQSDWLQKGQDNGFVSDFDIVSGDKLVDYFKKHNISYKIYDKKDMQSGEQGESPHYQFHKSIEFKQTGGKELASGDAPEIGPMDPKIKYIFRKSDNTEAFRWQPEKYEEDARYGTPEEFLQKAYGIVPDFPVKESKKWVELVLNKIIEKAILDGRDSIAITNGQIQANRYDAMGEEEKQGLKKFYDEIVFKQLEKISDKYNVELERIDISEPEEDPEDRQNAIQMQFPRQIKTAQKAGHVLEKITLQELWDRTKDTNIPGHTALYTKEGRGQGIDYIENYLNDLVTSYSSQEERSRTGLASINVYPERWDKIKNNEVYVWKKTIPSQHLSSPSATTISWDMPIVPVADTITNPAVNDMLNASSENREYIIRQFTIGGIDGYPYEGDNINNIDLIKYTEYLRNYKLPEGVDLGYDEDVEQLIKMKLPKKLQKERLSKPIKLTKAKQQTDRLFA